MTVMLRRRLARRPREAGAQPPPTVTAPEVAEEVADPFIFPDADGAPLRFATVALAAPSHAALIAGLAEVISHRRALRKLGASPAATLPIRYLIGVYRTTYFSKGAEFLLADVIRACDAAVAPPDIAPRAAALARDLNLLAYGALRHLETLGGSNASSGAWAAKAVVDASTAVAALPRALAALAAAVAPRKRAALDELAEWTILRRRVRVALERAFGEVGVHLKFDTGTSQGAIMAAWIVKQCTGETDVSPHTIASQYRRES